MGLSIHSYQNTLTEFLNRYTRKPENTKKGMMGELIAHLVINKVLPNLQKIGILFNKEERSIRKGFDLTYVEVDESVIWYGEVKSGEINQGETSDEKTSALLHEAKGSMAEFLTGQRSSLWNSVITDVGLSLAQDQHRKVKELLDADLQQIQNEGVQKSAILISVLFHDIGDPVAAASVGNCHTTIAGENRFANVILFSIQKSTYQRIEEFLRQEIAAQE
jgi:hypothetical protein